MLPLDCALEFHPAHEEEFFAALPARPAVFLIESHEPAARPYLARTADLRRRCERLLRVPELPTKRLNLREFAARVRYRLTGSEFEQALVLYQYARELHPFRARQFLRLRPPTLLKVNLANEYPRCYVTRRILADGAFYFGPFPSRRAAEAFADEFLNMFKIRRCQIKIRRDPAFPGCIYSEMKMCLAPCFAGCTKEEYDVEVSRVLGFLSTAGESLAAELEREREAMSESLDFERAAAVHRRIVKVQSVLSGLSDLARKVDEIDAVVLQRAAEQDTIALFRVRSGWIDEPFLLRFGDLASQPRSVEQILRTHLETELSSSEDEPSQPSEVASAAFHDSRAVCEELIEHLALLTRWFYSKPRRGEILFAKRNPSRAAGAAAILWPYRRILRACARLLAPRPAADAGEAASPPS